MKANLIVMVLMFVVAGAVTAQESVQVKKDDLPKVVYQNFMSDYPEATKMDWQVPDCSCYEDWQLQWESALEYETEREAPEPKLFYVNYKYKDNEQRTVYYRNGEWVETLAKMNWDKAPESVVAAVNNSEYSTWEVQEPIVFYQSTTDSYYKIRLKGGIKKRTLKVDLDGKLIPRKKLMK